MFVSQKFKGKYERKEIDFLGKYEKKNIEREKKKFNKIKNRFKINKLFLYFSSNSSNIISFMIK